MLLKIHYNTHMLKSVLRELDQTGRVVSKVPQEKVLEICFEKHVFAMGPTFLYQTVIFASLTVKPVGPCHWIM